MSGSEWTSHVPIDCVSVQSCQCGADEACKYVREIERLRGFARRVLRAWPEGDIDGGELQDAAIEAGLLVKVDPPPSEPCGERCSCADYYAPEDFASGDVVCYRRVREALGDA